MMNAPKVDLPAPGYFEEEDVSLQTGPESVQPNLPEFYGGALAVQKYCTGGSQFTTQDEAIGVAVDDATNLAVYALGESHLFPWLPDQRSVRSGYSCLTRPRVSASGLQGYWQHVMPRRDKLLTLLTLPADPSGLSTAISGAKPHVIFMPSGGPEAWLDHVLRELESLFLLPAGWNGPRALPLMLAPANAALEFLSSAMTPDAPLPSVVPLSNGGLQLEWHRVGLDVEVEFDPDGTAEMFVREIATGTEWEGDPEGIILECDVFQRLVIDSQRA